MELAYSLVVALGPIRLYTGKRSGTADAVTDASIAYLSLSIPSASWSRTRCTSSARLLASAA
jgi:hypothetical protein